jgi:protein-S-isoprenylcysteine O-methyltransferase Ste14
MPRKKKVITPEVEEFKVPEIIEEKRTLGQKAKKAGKIILGVLLILVGIFGIMWFLPEFIAIVKGVIGVIIVLIGILVLALGWLD